MEARIGWERHKNKEESELNPDSAIGVTCLNHFRKDIVYVSISSKGRYINVFSRLWDSPTMKFI